MRKDFETPADVIRIIKDNLQPYESAIALGGGKLGLESHVLVPSKSISYEFAENGAQWAENNGFAYKKTDLMRCKKIEADLVVAFDVLEHLPKERSLKLIEMAKCKQFAVFMPINERKLDEKQEPSPNGTLMKHISSWTEADFIELGFKTWVSEKYHKPENGGTDAIIAILTL
jgi:hypothetical protein